MEERIILGFPCCVLLFPPSDIPQEYRRTVILGVYGVYLLNPTSLARQGVCARSPRVWGPPRITTSQAPGGENLKGNAKTAPQGKDQHEASTCSAVILTRLRAWSGPDVESGFLVSSPRQPHQRRKRDREIYIAVAKMYLLICSFI